MNAAPMGIKQAARGKDEGLRLLPRDAGKSSVYVFGATQGYGRETYAERLGQRLDRRSAVVPPRDVKEDYVRKLRH